MSQTGKESEIPNELSKLHKAKEELRSTVEELRGRLKGVLRPEPECDAKEPPAELNATTPLGTELNVIGQSLNSTRGEIVNLMSLLEI